MKPVILFLLACCCGLTSCFTTQQAASSPTLAQQYPYFYNEKPGVILLMPPINHTNNVEAKEFLYYSLNRPLSEKGYYVIPPLLGLDFMKSESAYDAELFLEKPMDKFRDVFGADAALFIIIHTWEKMAAAGLTTVELEYIMRSLKTGDVIYNRRGTLSFDSSVTSEDDSLAGVLADVMATMLSTAMVKHIDVARMCNLYMLQDLPAGPYATDYLKDGNLPASDQVFNITLDR